MYLELPIVSKTRRVSGQRTVAFDHRRRDHRANLRVGRSSNYGGVPVDLPLQIKRGGNRPAPSSPASSPGYFFIRRRTARATPIRPVPSNSIEPGSGTAVTDAGESMEKFVTLVPSTALTARPTSPTS